MADARAGPALGYLRGLGCAAVLGVLGAVAAQGFRAALEFASHLLFHSADDISQVFAALPWYARLLVPTLGGALAACVLILAQRRERKAGVVSEYLEVIDGRVARVPVGASLLRCLSSFFSIASGGSIGKEGAMVQLAATLASMLGAPLRHLRGEDFRLGIAMAATGGLAAVYHTPLAAAIFIAEIAFGGIEPRRIGFLFTAAVASAWYVSATGHYAPLYALPAYAFDVTGSAMLAVAAVAVLAGGMGSVFLLAIQGARRFFTWLHASLLARMMAGGLVVGVITLVAPEVAGNGFAPVAHLLEGGGFAAPLLLLLVLKVLATAATVGSGGIGGLFTPSLMIGALTGAACGPLVAHGMDMGGSVALLTVAGMAAALAATTQAPLMSMLMVFEMTQEPSFIFPLMLATVLAYATSMLLGHPGTYDVIARHRARFERRTHLTDATAADAMCPADPTVPASACVAEAWQVGVKQKKRFVFVVDGSGRFRGAVWTQDLGARTAAGQGDEALDGLMVDAFPVVFASDRLVDVWQTVVESPAERTPVLADRRTRQLVGVLRKSDLLRQAGQLFA